MSDEKENNVVYGQRIRSLEARVKNNENQLKDIAISLTENNVVTKHLDKTMGEFSGAVNALGTTLVKVDSNLSHLAESLKNTDKKIETLETNTNKKFGMIEDKICAESDKNKIDIRAVGKNIVMYFVLPTTIIGTIITIVLTLTGVL